MSLPDIYMSSILKRLAGSSFASAANQVDVASAAAHMFGFGGIYTIVNTGLHPALYCALLASSCHISYSQDCMHNKSVFCRRANRDYIRLSRENQRKAGELEQSLEIANARVGVLRHAAAHVQEFEARQQQLHAYFQVRLARLDACLLATDCLLMPFTTTFEVAGCQKKSTTPLRHCSMQLVPKPADLTPFHAFGGACLHGAHSVFV